MFEAGKIIKKRLAICTETKKEGGRMGEKERKKIKLRVDEFNLDSEQTWGS